MNTIGSEQTVLATPFENAFASVSVTLSPLSSHAASPVTNSRERTSPEMSFSITASAASFLTSTISPATGFPPSSHLAASLHLPLPPIHVQVFAKESVETPANNSIMQNLFIVFISFPRTGRNPFFDFFDMGLAGVDFLAADIQRP